ncbi:MAG: type II toxin-antitoxin system ParD family antitoxin [Rhodospirillaceae bacterium]|jgi:antitoxin ParD1/3/4|nr:type II toxin-antitoxin system ParD family antitoxin [Rhodospirillaceae bacterium]
MATNVHLTPELETFARERVKEGSYNSVSEVVRSGLRLLKDQEDRKHAFDAMIAETLRETDEKGPRALEDVLAKAGDVIDAAER